MKIVHTSHASARPPITFWQTLAILFSLAGMFSPDSSRAIVWCFALAAAAIAAMQFVHEHGLANLVDRVCLAGHRWARAHRAARWEKDREVIGQWRDDDDAQAMELPEGARS